MYHELHIVDILYVYETKSFETISDKTGTGKKLFLLFTNWTWTTFWFKIESDDLKFFSGENPKQMWIFLWRKINCHKSLQTADRNASQKKLCCAALWLLLQSWLMTYTSQMHTVASTYSNFMYPNNHYFMLIFDVYFSYGKLNIYTITSYGQI